MFCSSDERMRSSDEQKLLLNKNIIYTVLVFGINICIFVQIHHYYEQ